MVKAYSNFNAAMYIGTGIAALLGAGLYEKLGSHVLLIAEFIIYSTAILLLSFLPNAHRPAKDTIAGFKERLKNSGLRCGIFSNRANTAIWCCFLALWSECRTFSSGVSSR